MNMNYNRVFQVNNVLVNIPLSMEGRKLPGKTAASVMLLRVAYGKKVNEFETDMQEVVKGLKKEGFDERARRYSLPEDDKERMTDEQQRKDFESERKELEDAYLEARKRKAEENVEMKCGTLTRDELADLYEVVGTEGVMMMSVPYADKPIEVGREGFLQMVAEMLVQ